MNQFNAYESVNQQGTENPESSVSEPSNSYVTGGISVADSTGFTPTYPYSSLYSNYGTANPTVTATPVPSINLSTGATAGLVLPSAGDVNSGLMHTKLAEQQFDIYGQHQQQHQQQYQIQQQIHAHAHISHPNNIHQFQKFNSPRTFDVSSNHLQDTTNMAVNYHINNHLNPVYTGQLKTVPQHPIPTLNSTNYHNPSFASTASGDSMFDDKSQANSIDGHTTSYSTSSTHSSTPTSSISSASCMPEYESIDMNGTIGQSDYASGKAYMKAKIELPSIGCINNNNIVAYNSAVYSNSSYEAVGLPYDCSTSIPNRQQFMNMGNINKNSMIHNNLALSGYSNFERKAHIVNGINEKFELLNIKKGKGGRKAVPLDGTTVLKVAMGGEKKRSLDASGGKPSPGTNSSFDTHEGNTHDEICDRDGGANSEIDDNDAINPQSSGNFESETSFSSVSDSNKGYKCSICSKSYTRNHNLVSHERTHRDLKPFKCSSCDKLFTRHHDLKRHESLHLKVKKFICRGMLSDNKTEWGCGRTFARKDSLLKHLQTKKARSKCIEKLIREGNRSKT